MWLLNFISNAMYFLFLYVLLPIIGIAIFGMVWPHIAGIVKFFIISGPFVLAFVMFRYGDIGTALLLLAGGLLLAIIPMLVCRLFDRLFGVLMTREEALKAAEKEICELARG